MATRKFTGRSAAFNKISTRSEKCTKLNENDGMVELMSSLLKSQRAEVCLRRQGVPKDQAAQCQCIFCSPEARRAHFEEFEAELAKSRAAEAARKSVDCANGESDKINNCETLQDVMNFLVERQRAAVCLRQQGVPKDQAEQCQCIFCSPEARRAHLEEYEAELAERMAARAAREKVRYVHWMLAYAGIQYNRRKSAVIRGGL